MALGLRLLVLFPLACSLAAMILSFLTLFAGQKEGFMEDYAIVRVNMSAFGHDLISTSSNDPQPEETEDPDASIWDRIGDKVGDVVDDAKDKAGEILNDVADSIADELGIAEWYSLHLMVACEGSYKPNATVSGAGYNVTNCTDPNPTTRINLTDMIDQDISVGPVDVSLAQLNWPEEIDDQIAKLNKLLLAVFIFYCLGIGFSGLCMIAAGITFFLTPKRRITLINFVLAFLAAFSLGIGSIITTVAAMEGAKAINKAGDDINVSADSGKKFIAISWAAFALMAVVTLYWTVDFCLTRWSRKREFTEKRI